MSRRKGLLQSGSSHIVRKRRATAGGRLTSSCSVMICDDRKEIREVVSKLIRTTPQFHQVGLAEDYASCLRTIRLTQPDVLILDLNLPGGGPRLAHAARHLRPDIQIIIFSGRSDMALQREMLAAGADQYIVKTGRIQPLVDALDRAASQHA